ncbi:hypothetical protein D0868_08513 [Hortaea werneckii]|uniref:Uncharacterized protein n=1 Tax=Hortaea werneckii TaxID=91943 RepID=A0A3M6YEM1_HORWE|nr:hypothetical protein D0868_08513 [Hortaea werneckii]
MRTKRFGKVLTMRQSQKNKQKPTDKDVVKTEPDRKRKDDLIAFLPPVEEPGKDFISSLPTETFHEILSYLILDHDPDRGLKLEALTRRGVQGPASCLPLALGSLQALS